MKAHDVAVAPPTVPNLPPEAHAAMTAGVTLGIIFVVVTIAMYFLPSIIAVAKKHPQMAWVIVLDIFLGWTVIGWIAAFIWSLAGGGRPQQIIVHNVAHANSYHPAPTPPAQSETT